MSREPASISYETLLRGAPTPLALLSNAGQVIACSPVWEGRWGSPGPLLERVHEDDRADLAARMAAARSASGAVCTTARLRDVHGAEVALRWTLWRADEAAVFAAVEVDRTAWEAQARLLVDVFQTMDAVIWWCDREGTLKLSEGRGLAYVGVKPGQLVGANIFNLYSADAKGSAICRRVLAGETVLDESLDEGSYWAMFYTPRRGDDGEVEGVQTLAVNFAGNVALAVQAGILRACIDSMPIVVWAFDKAGLRTIARGGGLAHLNAIQPKERGICMEDLCGGTEESQAVLRRVLSGEIVDVEQVIEQRIWRTRFVPQQDGLGQIIGLGAISEDVSQQRAMERQLREQLRLTQAQQDSIARLSSPILEVWEDVLIVPLIGALGPERAAMVMESLLAKVVATRASSAILDLTGIDSVDTSTAEHLIKIIRGLGLLGCRGVVTGIRPSVAQTIVGLGFDLAQIQTLRSLKEALRWCMTAAARR